MKKVLDEIDSLSEQEQREYIRDKQGFFDLGLDIYRNNRLPKQAIMGREVVKLSRKLVVAGLSRTQTVESF